jgi:hypothetical protein
VGGWGLPFAIYRCSTSLRKRADDCKRVMDTGFVLRLVVDVTGPLFAGLRLLQRDGVRTVPPGDDKRRVSHRHGSVDYRF